MDLNYLQNEILPKREQEIKNGKNLATKQRQIRNKNKIRSKERIKK